MSEDGQILYHDTKTKTKPLEKSVQEQPSERYERSKFDEYVNNFKEKNSKIFLMLRNSSKKLNLGPMPEYEFDNHWHFSHFVTQ